MKCMMSGSDGDRHAKKAGEGEENGEGYCSWAARKGCRIREQRAGGSWGMSHVVT